MRLIKFGILTLMILAINVAVAVPIKVGIIIGGSNNTEAGQSTAAQLNDDTFYDFEATFLTAASATNNLGMFDALVIGCTGNGCSGFDLAFMANARSYLENGIGGIVTTGWFNYGSNFFGGFMNEADAITPIVENQSYNFATRGNMISFTQPHKITMGISDFNVTASYWETSTAIDPEAVQIATAGGRSAIVVQESVGRSVYLGGLYSASSNYGTASMRTGVQDQLFEQAVAWASAVNVPSPNTFLLLLISFFGLIFTRKSLKLKR